MSESVSMILSLNILFAFIMDLFGGDPPSLPHPIRWMGHAIARWEPSFRSRDANLTRAGLTFTVVMVGGAWCLSFMLLQAAQAFSPLCGAVIEILMVYFCLATRSLYDAAQASGKGVAPQRPGVRPPPRGHDCRT
jgi:adenosylcobinamide-phosphate synthase